MKKPKPVKPLPVATVVPEPEIVPEPARVVSMEALDGSGDSLAQPEYVTTSDSIVEAVEVLTSAHASSEPNPEIANIPSTVGTETTPVVPATAEKLVFCDPPGVWMKA